MLRAAAAPAPEFTIPVKAMELANAYRSQPSAAVPSALLFMVIVVVMAPVFVIPVAAVTVPDVAIPRSVLLLIVSVAPVEAFLIPMIAAVAPVVEVRVPLLDRLPAFSV